MKRFFTSLSLVVFIAFLADAQMWNGQDSLYGNEWIDLSADYYKFQVREDGVYRIPQSALQSAGFPLASQPGANFRLYAYGEEVPIYVTTNGTFGGSDYIEFYGEKNRSQLDKHLFINPENEQLNPEYSMFTDKAAYYLTWSADGTPARFEATANNLNNPGNPLPYFIHESKVVYSNRPFTKADNNNVKFSNFDTGEGFGSIYSSNHEIALPAPALYANGPESTLDMRMVSDILEHELEIKFNGTTIIEENFVGFDLRTYSENIANGTISDENSLEILGNFDDKDNYGVSVVKLTYPRTFDFGALPVFAFDLTSGTKQYLEITNFSNTGSAPVLYDMTNKIRIETTVSNDQIRVVLPQGQSNRKLVLSNDSDGVKNITSLSKVNFPDLNSSNANYIIISHSELNNANSGTNQVAEYAAFRASPIGGNYDVQVINVKDIYECFGYGSPRHPISLRNFGNYIKKSWPNPEMIFMIGKGREYTFTRTDEDLNDPVNDSYYIPTFGTPGADNLLFSANNSSDFPVLPIGRLAATSPEDIAVYLDKAKSIAEVANLPQTLEEKGWTKKMLHLSGGDVTLQDAIAGNLKNFENIIENNTFGADVETFYKTSTDPIQISESEAIFDLINNGVSLITFFGHSGTGTFDFNIDNPDNFLNEGKLPLIISLGCYSGNIHSIGEGVSERFVFYEDKGAGAFLATTGPGYVYTLNLFGREFYQKLGEDNYGDPIGKILLESLKPLNGSNLAIRSLVQQLTLNGDPAILLNPHPGPDYTISNTSVAFNPMVINAQLDSFEISFNVENLGRAVRDSFQIVVEQQTPSGEKFTLLQQKIAAPFAERKVNITVPNFGSSASGLNRFFIKVDVNNEIEELPALVAEMNNSVRGSDNQEGIPLFIFDNSLEPIFPQDYAIVNAEQPVKLIGSTRDALLPESTFVVEIDTTETFNSAVKIRKEFTQIGGVLSWEPPVSWENGKVYYWRMSPDSLSMTSPYIWKNRSFVYLADSEPGWNQSHFYQYKKNEFQGMEVLSGEQFEYLENGFFITIRNKVNEPEDPPQYIYNFGNPSPKVKPWEFINSGMAFVIGDSLTGGAWSNPTGGKYGSVNPSKSLVFAFPTATEAQRATVIDFLDNIVPDKFFVFGMSVMADINQDFQPELWAADEIATGKSIFSTLENQGATKIRNLETTGSRPYTFVYQKGTQVFSESLAENINSIIINEDFIPILSTAGTVTTKRIGPASSWGNFEWSISQNDNPADSSFIQINGINPAGQTDTLVQRIEDFSYDLSGISAAEYPNLELILHSEDAANRTASNLTNWRITYESLPDIAIDPSTFFNIYQDTLQEGETFLFETAVINTGNYPIANTAVNATFSNLGASDSQQMTIDNLQPGESSNLSFSLETFSYGGNNNILVVANPEDAPQELYRFNNIASKNFYVNTDNSNPLLEVTFDGAPIMNGDIVSAKPHITISLKDENPYLALNDTTLLKLILEDPNKQIRGISFSDPAVTFYPANTERNQAIIEWDPTFEVDGDYQLIVQGEDVTGNQSGAIDYKINFKIINKKMISNVLNYPNPFSTATRFVYTLTGDETPTFFKIQIFSASGRIVKEITQNELGPMKIGTHRTDYVWDGTDDFGDRLANGVYFYKVVTKNAMGDNYESFINGNVDQFFDQGFGKLVIMR